MSDGIKKRDELRAFINREAVHAMNDWAADEPDRETAETVRGRRAPIAGAIAWHIAEQYRFLELADIMEWKRTRERR